MDIILSISFARQKNPHCLVAKCHQTFWRCCCDNCDWKQM